MTEPTSEEKEQAKKEPSSPSEAAKSFLEKKAEEKKKPPEGNEKEIEKKEEPGESEKGKDALPSPKLRLVNEKGEDSPLVIKVDGEDIEISDIDELITKAQFGHKGNALVNELNERQKAMDAKEKEIEDGLKLLSPYVTKAKAGELDKKEEIEEEIDEDEDPEEKIKRLEKDLKKMKTDFEALADFTGNYFVTDFQEKIQRELEALQPKYSLVTDLNDAWDELGKPENKGKKPEQIMKALQEKEEKRFEAHLKNHPEALKLKDKEKEAYLADYLAEKKEREAAPVGTPSGEAAGTGGDGEDKKKEITSPSVGYELFKKKKAAERKATQQL